MSVSNYMMYLLYGAGNLISSPIYNLELYMRHVKWRIYGEPKKSIKT